MKIKELYRRFRAWQLAPFGYEKEAAAHICANCGGEYRGDYCPTCGQKHNLGRVGWKSVGMELTKIFGMESRSLLSSLIQLLGRPGYLIGDYISGRRQVCYSPVSMLFVVAVVISILLRLTGVSMIDETDLVDVEEDLKLPVQGLIWMRKHLGWAMLITTAFMVFPTWLLFRHSPRHTKHTFPEGIYIQIFMSTLVLIFFIAGDAVAGWFFGFIPLYYFLAFRQLFGYGLWGTFWRTVLVLAETVFLAVLLVMAVMCLAGYVSPGEHSLSSYIIAIVILIVFNVGILYFGRWIGKLTARRRVGKQLLR